MNDSKKWYAVNARKLLDTRKQGMTPSAPVVVSLVGQEFEEIAVYAKPDMPVDRLDWRMLVNLNVWVWASAQASIDWVSETLWRIAMARPSELLLRFEHGDTVHDIDIGTGIHHPKVQDIAAVHTFLWLPVNVGGTRLGRRITRRGFGYELPER